jgi:hypothetical protein
MKSHLLHLTKILLLTGVLVGGLSACAPPKAITGPNGALNILSLPAGFDVDDLADGWFLAGDAGTEQISTNKADPLHELKVTSSNEGFALTRKTDAILLATPYLNWRWNPVPGDWNYHPVRILIGFNGGSAKPSKAKGLAKLFPNLDLPPHDRGLSIIWGPSALMRGTLIHMKNVRPERQEAYYTVRGGRENAGKWWAETIDLSHLYAKAWPRDDISKAKIVFLGIGAAKSAKPHTAFIGDIRLSR